jgi:hypothetical protein
MKTNFSPFLSLALFVAVSGSLLAAPINYPDFTEPKGLLFQGDAALQTNFARLTPAQPRKIGGLWLQSKQTVTNGTHKMYASTNLADWILVTNLNIYFTDPNAPDYDHRFFTFGER